MVGTPNPGLIRPLGKPMPAVQSCMLKEQPGGWNRKRPRPEESFEPQDPEVEHLFDLSSLRGFYDSRIKAFGGEDSFELHLLLTYLH